MSAAPSGTHVCSRRAWGNSLQISFLPRVLGRYTQSAQRRGHYLRVTVNSFQTRGPQRLRTEAAVAAEGLALPPVPAGRLWGPVVILLSRL